MAKRSLDLSPKDGLMQVPHDPYWDAPISRREVQEAVNQLAGNDEALAAQNDTSNIVLNFLCEKIGIERKEIDIWVAKKQLILQMYKMGILKKDEKGNFVAPSDEEVDKFGEEQKAKQATQEAQNGNSSVESQQS